MLDIFIAFKVASNAVETQYYSQQEDPDEPSFSAEGSGQ